MVSAPCQVAVSASGDQPERTSRERRAVRRAASPSSGARVGGNVEDVRRVEQPVVSGQGRAPSDGVGDDVVFHAEGDDGEVVGLEDGGHCESGRFVGLGGADDQRAVAILDGDGATSMDAEDHGIGRGSQLPEVVASGPSVAAMPPCEAGGDAGSCCDQRGEDGCGRNPPRDGPRDVVRRRWSVRRRGFVGVPGQRDERSGVVEPACVHPAAAGDRCAEDGRGSDGDVERDGGTDEAERDDGFGVGVEPGSGG